MAIGGRRVGPGAPVLVIAEAGVNHNGDPELALSLVEAAAASGADAVKFQAFRADDVAAPGAPKADYQLAATGAGQSQLEMLRALELEEAAWEALKECADKAGVVFLASAFDEASVAFLDRLGVAAFKVGSGEMTNHPLLAAVGSRGRPVIVSTGTADLGEVEAAVGVVRRAGAEDVAVLHCVSAYPAVAEDANLNAMATLAERLRVPVGFSDHTIGDEVALAAVALGACILEKHFTLDRSLPGPDQRASLEPGELAELVRRVRRVEAALGDGVKRPTATEQANAAVVRRSLAAAEDLAAGAVVTREMLTALRPGTGIAPTRIDDVVGRRLTRDVPRHALLALDDLE